MNENKNKIVEKIRDSLVKPPTFLSESSNIDKHFAAFYTHLTELEVNYDTADVSEKYFIEDVCTPIDELILFLNQEFNEKTDEDKTLPLSLNDMKLIDQYIKFITLQLIYRNLPVSIKPQMYLLTTDSKGIYGNFNQVKRNDDINLLRLILEKLLNTFFKTPSSKGNEIFRSCIKLSNFHYDLIMAVIYLVSKTGSSLFYETQWDMLENVAIDTYDLYVNYSTLINYLKNTPILQKILSERISNLIVKKVNGLKSLIEFILQTRETEDIELTKLTQLTEVVIKKPSFCRTNKDFFTNLFNQIFQILEMENNSNIIIAIMNILSTLFIKNQKIINDFFNKRLINEYLLFSAEASVNSKVSFSELLKKVNVIISLTKQNDSNFITSVVEYYNEYDFMFLIYRYINFIYINWKRNNLDNNLINESYVNSLISCLKFYLMCSNDKWYLINYLIVNYDFNCQNERFGKFIIKTDKTFELSFLTEITKNTEEQNVNSKIQDLQLFIKLQDLQNDLLIKLLETLMNNGNILTNVFVTILRRWCESYTSENTADIFLQLNDLRIMNRLLELESFKDEVSQNSQNILIVIADLLTLPTTLHEISTEIENDSDDEEDDIASKENDSDGNVLQMLLKLLSFILASTEKFDNGNKAQLEIIRGKLGFLKNQKKAVASLVSKITKILTEESAISLEVDNDENNKERQELKQALANLNDPLAPIKAQGLYELRELILKKSKVVDHGIVLELHLLEMKNKEPFVYLNSIKGLVILCENEASLDYLMKLYDEYDNKDSNLAITFEEELRLGEVLSQFFQNKKYLFGKDINLHKMFNIVLRKINAKNVNKLDNRVRMSAMSILGIMIQLNMDLMSDSELIDCFNCIKGILTFEFDEKDESFKLLRRSSTYLLYDMVYNSGLDRFVISYEEYERLIDLLKYNRDVKEKDDLSIDLISKLLSLVDEIWNETYKVREDPDDTFLSNLKII
ncbi:hypothetical protein QEN19_000319 [Hanseniaspora menglaensis]